MAVRFVHAERGHIGRAVRARAALLAQTRSVLVVSARLPAPVLRRELADEGVDLARIFVLDVTSHGIAPTGHDPEHEAYLPGPGMLELITKRATQIIRAKAERDATVLVDDVATFARYNPPGALAEILAHAIAVRSPTTTIEYVFSGEEPAAVARAAAAAPMEQYDILPSGDLALRPQGRAGDPVVGVRETRPPTPPRGPADAAPGPAGPQS